PMVHANQGFSRIRHSRSTSTPGESGGTAHPVIQSTNISGIAQMSVVTQGSEKNIASLTNVGADPNDWAGRRRQPADRLPAAARTRRGCPCAIDRGTLRLQAEHGSPWAPRCSGWHEQYALARERKPARGPLPFCTRTPYQRIEWRGDGHAGPPGQER